jgi:ABC-type transport system involved in cytochrome c biogenesis permease component
MLNLLIFNLKQHFIFRNVFLSQTLLAIIVIIGITLASSPEEIKQNAKIIFIIIPQIIFCLQSDYYFRKDFDRGILEFSLTTYENYQIYFSKIISMFILSLATNMIILSVCYLCFNLDVIFFKKVFLGAIPFIAANNLINSVGSAINIYFQDKGNLISSITLPFHLPSFVLFGLYVNNFSINLLFILSGLVLILIPVSYFLTCSLLREIYNS